MQVKILNVDVENVTKGKSRYSVATVAYMAGGEAKTQKIMSFANPDVFKKVQDYVGKEVYVTITKNEAGYNQWSSIGEDAGQAPAPTAAPTGTRVTGSNFETPAERATKQVYIVKQSSITAALTTLQAAGTPITKEAVVETAQFYVDWVFDTQDGAE